MTLLESYDQPRRCKLNASARGNDAFVLCRLSSRRDLKISSIDRLEFLNQRTISKKKQKTKDMISPTDSNVLMFEQYIHILNFDVENLAIK